MKVPTVFLLVDIISDASEITPDQFDWYFHQGRAIGLLEDLNCDSICNGKMLLGSYMKKPLWVDHSAKTVSASLTLPVTVVLLLLMPSLCSFA